MVTVRFCRLLPLENFPMKFLQERITRFSHVCMYADCWNSGVHNHTCLVTKGLKERETPLLASILQILSEWLFAMAIPSNNQTYHALLR
ncbi:hypothetical protein BT93_F2399 [Corymbia citriodora subsp. variegata]|nr:hypothetical protein BT93_F2399 [Corymbia citriodora subsp. variegata]